MHVSRRSITHYIMRKSFISHAHIYYTTEDTSTIKIISPPHTNYSPHHIHVVTDYYLSYHRGGIDHSPSLPLKPTSTSQPPPQDIQIPFHLTYTFTQEDITAISNNIGSEFVAHDSHITYQYFFLYFKFGQMEGIHSPISLPNETLGWLYSCHFSSNCI